jgi:hypothetical protein
MSVDDSNLALARYVGIMHPGGFEYCPIGWVVFSPFGSRGYIAWFVYTFENPQVTHAVLGKVDIEVTSYAHK